MWQEVIYQSVNSSFLPGRGSKIMAAFNWYLLYVSIKKEKATFEKK